LFWLPSVDKKNRFERMRMSFFSRRNQDQVLPVERRDCVIKVRLNRAELSDLDEARGRHSRAETFRFLLLNKMPRPVPTFNLEAWQDLARAAANLNQIAAHLNGGGQLDLPRLRAALDDFRERLIGAQSW
jgi:hypothetical protein